MNEADFQRRVLDTAKLHGWMVAHFRPALTRSGRWATPMQGDTGFPDLVLARGGRILLAELKSDTGRLSPAQRRWIVELGGFVRVWRPRDWDSVLAELSAPREQAA